MKDRYAQRQARGITVARGVSPEPWVRWFHAVVRLGSRALRGHYERIDPATYVFPEPEKVPVGDLELRYLRWRGKGPTLLLLHGLNANAWIWARVANLLCDGRDVIAVDQRGHGGSSIPSDGYAHERTTSDLLAFLDQVAEGPVDVAGHSWGGMVATHLAATAPERIRSLILADPVLPKGLNFLYRSLDKVIDAVFAAERGPFPNQQAWEEAAREISYLYWEDEMDRRLWSECFRRQPDGSYQHVLPDSGFEEIFYRTLMTNFRPLLRQIAAPTLLMLPSSPVHFLPGEYQVFRRSLFVAQRRVRGDHSFIHSNAVATAGEMRLFLDRVSPRERV